MKYASWVTKDIEKHMPKVEPEHVQNLKPEHVPKATFFHPDFREIIERLLTSERTEIALRNLKRIVKSDTFTFDFIERLSRVILYARHRPKHTHFTKNELEEMAVTGQSAIGTLNRIISKLGLDQPIEYVIPDQWRLLIIKGMVAEAGSPMVSIDNSTGVRTEVEVDNPFMISIDKSLGSEAGQTSDLLKGIAHSLRDIAETPTFVPQPHTNRNHGADRTYFVKALYVEFIREFGSSSNMAITEISNLFLEDDIDPNTVKGIIDRFKAKTKHASQE